MERLEPEDLKKFNGRFIICFVFFTLHHSKNFKRIILETEFCSFRDHLDEIEKELGITGQILLLMGPSRSNGFRLETIRKSKNEPFITRLEPLKEWCGVMPMRKLEEVSGIPNFEFCHRSGFKMAFKTRDAAISAIEKMFQANNIQL